MKKSIILTCLLLACNLLFAKATSKKEIFRKLNNSYELFLYEIYDEKEELIYYEIKASQGILNESISYVRCYDKKTIIKFLSQLSKCPDYDYKKYISNYAENNDNLTFLWDDYEIKFNSNFIETFCYKLE